MSEIALKVSPLTEAFLQTARSRRAAVEIFRKLYRMPDGTTEIDPALAIEIVEQYYAQCGGKPWLKTKEPS